MKGAPMRQNFFNRLCYILFFVLLAILYRFFVSYFLLLLMLTMVVFPVFSIIILHYTARNLTFSITGPAQIERGNDAGLTLHIKNHTIFPIARARITLDLRNLFYPQPDDYTFVCGIAAGKENTIFLRLNSTYCGIQSISLKEVRIWDYAGLTDLKISAESTATLCTLPKMIEADFSTEAVGGAGLTELVEQEVKGNDSSQVIDTRDYQPGDKLQRIHWKLSTKLDHLLVKEYGSISSNDVLVLMELYQDFPASGVLAEEKRCRERFDRIFDVYYTLACHLLEQKRPFTLCWYAPALGELKREEITTREEASAVLYQLYYEAVSHEPDAALSMCRKTIDEYGDFIYIYPAYPACESQLQEGNSGLLFSCIAAGHVLASAAWIKC
jgi:uncharacterized protein (DUF58 family)